MDRNRVYLLLNAGVLMPKSSREIISALKADGWYEVGQEGSHVHFKHLTKTGKATVPHPYKTLKLGTLKGIERQTGVKLR